MIESVLLAPAPRIGPVQLCGCMCNCKPTDENGDFFAGYKDGWKDGAAC